MGCRQREEKASSVKRQFLSSSSREESQGDSHPVVSGFGQQQVTSSTGEEGTYRCYYSGTFEMRLCPIHLDTWSYDPIMVI